jgi:predicted ATP-binding protein involved in virulence
MPDRDFTKSKSLVSNALQALGIDMAEIEPQLEPFFNRLAQYSQILKDKESFKSIFDSKDQSKISAAFEWMVNRPQFERILLIFNEATNYVDKCQKVNAQINNYLNVINEYLQDSNKTIEFDRSGELMINIPKFGKRTITSLSSGESQIVTILTHLAFNPAAKADNVFIIDEPELSLHLHWQELFIDSIRELNPKIQIIVVTHSPAIILDRVDSCIDLTRRK